MIFFTLPGKSKFLEIVHGQHFMGIRAYVSHMRFAASNMQNENLKH